MRQTTERIACALWLGAALLAHGWLAASSAWAAPGDSSDLSEASKWAFDQIHLSDGSIKAGMIEKEDSSEVHLMQVNREPGKVMSFLRFRVSRDKISKVTRLSDADRATLRQKIDDYRNRTRSEDERMSDLRIQPLGADWAFEGEWFKLISSAEETITRRSIVRMEDVFTAYRALMPPRLKPKEPVQILLFGSSAEYKQFLAKNGINLSNPAFYVSQLNLVVAASDLDALAAQLADVTAHHEKLRDELDALKIEVAQQLKEETAKIRAKGVPPAVVNTAVKRVKNEFEKKRKEFESELNANDRKNKKLFDDATRQMFRVLFHEAFHAYLENYVYSIKENDTPRWLNEGLAQLFETGLLEAGSMRVDAPDKESLQRLQGDLKGADALRLYNVITSGAKDFLVERDGDSKHSTRVYTYSWGLAYYLALEKKLLGGAAMHQFVAGAASDDSQQADPKQKADEVKQFEALVGMSLPEFEAEWREYMLKKRQR